MKEYFKLTGKKILGVIILLFLFSFLGFFVQFTSNPTSYLGTSQTPISIGFPLEYISLKGASINSLNPLNLIIDLIIFYLVTVFFALVFRGGKKENVPNSYSGGGNTSPPNQAQPGQ